MSLLSTFKGFVGEAMGSLAHKMLLDKSIYPELKNVTIPSLIVRHSYRSRQTMDIIKSTPRSGEFALMKLARMESVSLKCEIMSKQNPNPMEVMPPLSDEEIDELDSFLMSPATSDETMMLDCLDGFLTAIVSGPVMLKPSEWLPRVWGPTARDEPTFETYAQAERITGLMMRHLNGIIWNLHQDPDGFQPIFDTAVYQDNPREYVDGEMWAYGYMTGINIQRSSWKAFFDFSQSNEVLRPIHLLGADEVTLEEEELTKTPAQREELSEQIPASVAWIYKFWEPYRRAVAERNLATSFQRGHPKIGRNDVCTCGSGKKFKKCCGASSVLH